MTRSQTPATSLAHGGIRAQVTPLALGGTLVAEEPGDGPETGLLAIGRVAELAGVSERTLRYYEEIGLLRPAGHSPGGCRRYASKDVDRLLHIRELQQVMGYSLEEIRDIVAAKDKLEEIGTACRSGQDPGDQLRLVEEAVSTLDELGVRVRAKVTRLQHILAKMDAASGRYHELAGRLRERE